MTDTTPLAPAGATAVSIPVPSAAVPPTTNDPAQPPAATDSAKTAEPDQAEVKEEQPRSDDGKFKSKSTAEDRKARIQSDIDELTAKKRSLEREYNLRRDDALRQRQQMQEQAPPDDPYDPAHAARQAVREDRFEQSVSDVQRIAQEARDAQSAVFLAKVNDARERIPDLDSALQNFAQYPLSEAACDLIAESDHAAELAYYLAKNPNEARKVMSLPAHRQGAEIARMEARVSQAPQARKHSNAPPPPPMIGGTSSPTNKTLAEMGVEDIGKMIYGRA